MQNHIASTRTNIFPRENFRDTGPFQTCQCVRQWLVLRTLDIHRSGDYVTDHKEMQAAFALVIDGVRAGRVLIQYAPKSLLHFDIPSSQHPLHLQAMVYWCAKMTCSLEMLAEAHATLGNHVPLKSAFAVICRLKREKLAKPSWVKTIFKETITPKTMPMQLVFGDRTRRVDNLRPGAAVRAAALALRAKLG